MLRYDATIARWSASAEASCPRQGFVPASGHSNGHLAEQIPAKQIPPGRQA